MPRRIAAVLLFLGAALAAPLPADAAGRTEDAFPGMSREDAERLHEAGEQACRQMLDGAARLGEQLRVLTQDLTRQMTETRDQFAREVAPTLRDLAARLQDVARQLEQPPAKR